eukprot:363707_1
MKRVCRIRAPLGIRKFGKLSRLQMVLSVVEVLNVNVGAVDLSVVNAVDRGDHLCQGLDLGVIVMNCVVMVEVSIVLGAVQVHRTKVLTFEEGREDWSGLKWEA